MYDQTHDGGETSDDFDPPAAARGMTRPLPVALRWFGLAALTLAFAVGLGWIGLPAAQLLGPMVAAILCALGGAKLALPPITLRFAQAVVGCMIARVLTPPVLREVAADWPIFLLGVTSVIGASTALGWTLARLRVLPGTTAIWGSSPGAASAMTLMAGSFGADMRLVAFMQYTRVVIVAGAAASVARIWAVPSAQAAPATDWFAAPDGAALLGTLALILGAMLIGRVSRISAAPMLLPLVLGTAAQNFGLLRIELPPLLLLVAYLCIGWGVGLRFDRAVIRHASRALPRVLASILCLVAICGGFAALLVRFAGVDPLTAYLATSPGGADTVAIIAVSAKVDLPFVMSMQTARLVMVIVTGPAIVRFVAHRLAKRDLAATGKRASGL